MTLRVAVAGVFGRMGRETATALAGAEGIALAGGLARSHGGESLAAVLGLNVSAGIVHTELGRLYDRERPDVVVDFTVMPASREVAREAVLRGISPVIGASGWDDAAREALAALCRERGVGAALVPNFAIGAVLAMQFAERAAPYFPTAEIVEYHHDRKRDKPSGTAAATAHRIAAATARDAVTVHSVRLRGLVAHQEVLFGGSGEILTIRHDSLSRASFVPGILLAVRGVRARRELVFGLEPFMESHP